MLKISRNICFIIAFITGLYSIVMIVANLCLYIPYIEDYELSMIISYIFGDPIIGLSWAALLLSIGAFLSYVLKEFPPPVKIKKPKEKRKTIKNKLRKNL